MSNFNLVVIMGRLTRDVEMKYTPKGSAVAKIGLAVNRKWKSENGDQKEEATFLDATAWGETAEVLAQYLKKGDPIHISGRLQTESWTDKVTNQQRSKLGVVIETFQFIGSGSKSESKEAPKQSEPPAKKDDEEDSVPF